MRKSRGRNYSVYLPEPLMSRVELEADEEDRSKSQIVARALRRYFEEQKVAA